MNRYYDIFPNTRPINTHPETDDSEKKNQKKKREKRKGKLKRRKSKRRFPFFRRGEEPKKVKKKKKRQRVLSEGDQAMMIASREEIAKRRILNYIQVLFFLITLKLKHRISKTRGK